MRIRENRGGFSAAEGCMFAAVGLFVLLLVALLALAVLRARNPPEPLPGRIGKREEVRGKRGGETGSGAGTGEASTLTSYLEGRRGGGGDSLFPGAEGLSGAEVAHG